MIAVDNISKSFFSGRKKIRVLSDISFELERGKILTVIGKSGSGKTTLLKHIFSSTHNYVSLDNPDTRLMANNDPSLFLENYPAPVIIDEVQYAPNLFSFLKMNLPWNRDFKRRLTGIGIKWQRTDDG